MTHGTHYVVTCVARCMMQRMVDCACVCMLHVVCYYDVWYVVYALLCGMW